MGSEVTMFADDTRLFNIEKSKLWEYIPNKLENTITALSAFMVRCQSDMKKNSYSFVLPSKGREGNTDDAKERPAASSLQKRLLKWCMTKIIYILNNYSLCLKIPEPGGIKRAGSRVQKQRTHS